MENLIEVKSLKKFYEIKDQKGNFLFTLKALDGVDVNVGRNEFIGVVGESGCGKSTLGKTMLNLIERDGGDVLFRGKSIFTASRKEQVSFRADMQIVFQDPYSSLNRRHRVEEALDLPLRIHKKELSRQEREDKIDKILEEVGLDPQYKKRYPHQFSGGQRQRVAIARAVISNPYFIVADECVSALDVSVQAQILNLLNDLRHIHGFSCLFISHDLMVVEYIADTILVMYMGKIVERGGKEEIKRDKLHPYTKMLFDSHPVVDLSQRGRKREVIGEVMSHKNMPVGCSFCPRCPRAMDKCKSEVPSLKNLGNGREVACWLY